MLNLCRRSIAVRAKTPTIEAGSTRTKELGIPVGTLEVQLGIDHLDHVFFHDLDGVLSGQYKYQPEMAEKFDPEISHWADYRVVKVHRVRAKAQPAQIETGGESVAA